jgi:hypothetical protein
MTKSILLLSALAAVASTALAVTDPKAAVFDPKQLSGWWAESYNTESACGPQNVRSTMEVDLKAQRLQMRFDRKWKTELGETDHFSAKIVSSTARTLVIQYDNETRRRRNGELVEWELAMVAPGVYRWRETEWRPGDVNTVVGIRCTE